MSNLLKSKFLVGVLIVAAMFVVVGFSKPTTASADCSITTTLRVGSTGAQVVCLQTSLGGLTADGSFGPMTKAAVVSWQAKSGLVADGVFGPLSNAVWMANAGNTANFPAGCVSASGFSLSTGLPCSGGVSNLPAGCSTTAGFSPTTGMACSVTTNLPAGCSTTAGFSPTTGASCSVTTNLPAGCSTTAGFSPTTGLSCSGTVGTTPSGTNGYLTDIASDSSNRVSTVYESETDKVVAGFRVTARLSSQVITRVRVEMKNTDNGGSSANLAKYITGASLWLGSTKLATMSIANADRSTSTDVYTFNFAGLNAPIAKDAIGRIYFSVSVNGSLDTLDANNANWAVVFPTSGLSSSSPDGSYDTYSAAAGNIPSTSTDTTWGLNVGFAFGKFLTNGVKATVGLSTSNPVGGIVTVQTSSATNNVTLLNFTVKATNSDLTLRKVPIQMVTSGATAPTIINSIKLYKGATLIDSLDGSAVCDLLTPNNASTAIDPTDCATIDGATTFGYLFSNLSSPDNIITSGTTAEFSVVVDIKQNMGGKTLTASLTNQDALLVANLSINDTNGDQLTAGAGYRIGSAIGSIQTLLVNGVNVVMGAPSYTTVTDSGNITQVTYTIPVTATAFGQTMYVGQSVLLGDASTGATTAAKAFSYSFEDSAAPAVHINSCTSCVETLSSSDATIEGNGYRLDSGTAKHFTITVVEITPTTGAKSYRIVLNDIRTATESTLAAPANQSLVPVQSYQTGYQYITS